MNKKLKFSLYIAAIFVAGIVSGIFLSYQVVRRMMPNQERIASHWCHELQSRLQLSPQQTEKIRPVIDHTLEDFTKSLAQQMVSSLSNCNAQIALELTPAQRISLAAIQREKEGFIRSRLEGSASTPDASP